MRNGPKSPWSADDRARIISAACDWIATGKTLREFCRQPEQPDGTPTPSFSLIYEWLREDGAEADEHRARFSRARDTGADVIAEEALEIIDAIPSTTERGVDNAAVAWARNRAELRLKLLAKWRPQKYGDKLDLTTQGDKLRPGVVLLPTESWGVVDGGGDPAASGGSGSDG